MGGNGSFKQLNRPTSTLAAIVKDEGRAVAEWAVYHRLIGFNNIEVYDNESSMESKEILYALREHGVIKLVDWPNQPGAAPQLAAYEHAFRNCKTDWLMFLDADEFLNFRAGEDVPSFLETFEADVGAVGINWRIFGSAGRTNVAEELVIEAYTCASHHEFETNRHLKTIARVANVEQWHIHFCVLKTGSFVDAGGALLSHRDGIADRINHQRVQVNHYVIKSREDFERKKARGNANRAIDAEDKYRRTNETFFEAHDRNEVVDTQILHWLSAVSKALEDFKFPKSLF